MGGMRRLIAIILPLFILIGWEVAAIVINNEFFLPKLESVVTVLMHPTADVFGSGSLLEHAGFSIERVVLGFLIGTAIALPLGVGMGHSHIFEDFFDTTVQIFRPIPPIAWLPLSLAWFKIGITSIVFIIFIGAFFPILLNTIDGVKGVKKTWLEVASTLGATERQLLTKVILPGAAPTIWTGLRVGFGIAWMTVVAAEMLPGTSHGLGYMILYSYNFGQIQYIIAGMIVIGIIGLGFDFLFKEVEKKRFFWRSLER
jgi:NitT/TauT family transport system permease protein